jgi:hypothetical protein
VAAREPKLGEKAMALDFDFEQFRFFWALGQLRRKLRPEIEEALQINRCKVEEALQINRYNKEQVAQFDDRAQALVRDICRRDGIAVPEEFLQPLASGIVFDILYPESRSG